ncbi:MAG TPA: 30S ribosomal protein S1 [Terriglobales bacterium]
MPDTTNPEPEVTSESGESFSQLLSEYEQSHSRKGDDGAKQLEGTVISTSAEAVFLDIGYKIEGVLPLTLFQGAKQPPKPGDKFFVTIKGRNEEGYYELVRGKIAQPTDWAALEKAFAEKTTIGGTVTGAVKGGLSVDVGIRAFMPASRTGTRDAAEMEKLVGQEIRCRITKLDATEEDVVVDRRVILEEEELANKQRRFAELKEGETLHGTVRSLTDYGAFVDLGGVDALLHVSDISWSRVQKPADVLSAGQEVDVKVLKVDPQNRRISVGMKQLLAHPWDAAAAKYKSGERVSGTVTKLMDFGAFVEIEPGVEGLIHVSEMSWSKRVQKPGDVVKPGDQVEAVILSISPSERRIALGLKQALGDPWVGIDQKFPVGFVIEGPVTSLTKFGAFVQLSEGVEGLIHVSDMSAEKRINDPKDILRVGQQVKAQVLEIDPEKRRLKLGMKQLIPTSVEEYIAEHKVGDVISGRVVDVLGQTARVQVGEGLQVACAVKNETPNREAAQKTNKADLSSLTSMLQARWKGGAGGEQKQEPIAAGQIRQFRIAKLDAATKKIELELA